MNDGYLDGAYALDTPERVDLGYDVAGLGSRFLAALIDATIQVVVILALLVAIGLGSWMLGQLAQAGYLLDGSDGAVVVLALVVLVIFLITWGYYIFFELVWNGQTPGKRRVGIRVLSTGGRPITLAQSMIRNLVRIVDFLPSNYMLGAAVMLLNDRSQRLGDLAAGTMVIKERRAMAPPTLTLPPDRELAPQHAAAITAEDVALAREFLLRRAELAPERRRELADRIVARLRTRLDPAVPVESAESLLARVAALRRSG